VPTEKLPVRANIDRKIAFDVASAPTGPVYGDLIYVPDLPRLRRVGPSGRNSIEFFALRDALFCRDWFGIVRILQSRLQVAGVLV
jgi:hypothetical protein